MIRISELPSTQPMWLRLEYAGPHPRYPNSGRLKTLTLGKVYRLLGRLDGNPHIIQVRNDRGAKCWVWEDRFKRVW